MNIRIKLIRTKTESKLHVDMLEMPSKTISAQKIRLKARLEWMQKLGEERDRQYLLNTYADPIDAIRDQMIARGMKQKDLAPILGGKNRVSEVLARRRPLTLVMVRKLNQQLGIPADLLIREIRIVQIVPIGTQLSEAT